MSEVASQSAPEQSENASSALAEKAKHLTPKRKRTEVLVPERMTPKDAKRERKKPEVFVPESATKKEVNIPEGDGDRFSDFSEVVGAFNKKTNEKTVKNLHNIIFRNAAKVETKQHLLSFSGLVYTGDKEEERKKFVEKALKLRIDELRDITKLLGISVASSQKKEQVAEELIDFLEKPKFEFEEKKKRTPKKSPKKAKKNAEGKEEGEGKGEENGEEEGKEEKEDKPDSKEAEKETEAPPKKKKKTLSWERRIFR